MEEFSRPCTLVVKRDEGTVSPSFDIFIMEVTVDILFLDNKLIDKYLDDVYAVAKDIVNNYLSIAEKTKLLIDKKYHHFGMGLWIRNNFIYTNHSFNEYEPDEMSSHVHETIIAILESNKNKGKISFYELSGKLKSKVRMDKENIGKTHGMMVRCFLTDNTILEGFCYAFSETEPDKVDDTIILEKWKNYDYYNYDLIGDNDNKFEKIKRKVNIDDIMHIDAIICSNPRWGCRLINRFEFTKVNDLLSMDDIELPSFLKNSR